MDLKTALVEVSGIYPESGCLKQDLRPHVREELPVFCYQVIRRHRIGNVPIDMIRGSSGWKITRTLLSHNSSPWI
jgi:hypothetical protein